MLDSDEDLSHDGTNEEQTVTHSISTDASSNVQDGVELSNDGRKPSETHDGHPPSSSNTQPATNTMAMESVVKAIDHIAKHIARSPLPSLRASGTMLEVPKEEVHPLNYERNAAIPEHTWKRQLTDVFKPLKEFKVLPNPSSLFFLPLSSTHPHIPIHLHMFPIHPHNPHKPSYRKYINCNIG